MAEFHHIPVLLNECLEGLNIRPEGTYLDGTLGGAGHSVEILKRLTTGRLYGIDRDEEAIAAALARIEEAGLIDRFLAIHGNFHDAKALLEEQGANALDGALLDLGVSSHQLDEGERGFSYQGDYPLDMRMDQTASFTARDLVNGYSYEQLCRVLWDYGEERYAPRIADRIVRERAVRPIETTVQLMDIVCAAMPISVLAFSGTLAISVSTQITIYAVGNLPL